MGKSKLLFHMTHIENLRSILENNGLSAYSEVATSGKPYRDIANAGIQDQRSGTSVPLPPYGDLHDYVPFYFAGCSPMLYKIKNSGIKQSEIVYLMTNTSKIHENGLPFVFTDGHAIMFLTEFYSSLDDIDKVDWAIMKERYWGDTQDDPDRKRRRQAEFLVHRKVPLEQIIGIGVFDSEMKEEVEALLKSQRIDIPVGVRRHYYY